MSSTYDASFEDFLRDTFDLDMASGSTRAPDSNLSFEDFLGDAYDTDMWTENWNFDGTQPPHQSDGFQLTGSTAGGFHPNDYDALQRSSFDSAASNAHGLALLDAEVSQMATFDFQLSDPIGIDANWAFSVAM
ncbi:hypothetical protein H2199_009297 [Coniosporium tulheliwenetii]|uniref:Uncharacterized protein n=1 Tax=Coniosporium tulheliwenetii TaxID=3383036 RepID=A0ACC2YEM6_9PEZI|nr:hypothetical protein H2199_009297 [Cladosporium sp. JES 115]